MAGTARSRREVATGGLTSARSRSYRVRRWTNFTWAQADSQRERDRESSMERAARLINNRLLDMYPDSEPHVAAVRDGGALELRFTLMVTADSEDDARRKAIYYISRGMTVKMPAGVAHVSQRARLDPPWGKIMVEELDAAG